MTMRFYYKLIRISKIQNPAILNAAIRQSKRNFHSLLMTMQNDTATLQDSLAVPYTAEHMLTIRHSNCVPRNLPN